MAAVGLAIIGKNNSPLYVREFLSEQNSCNDRDDEAVLFGLKPNSRTKPAASARCWFALHEALDRLEQLTKTLDGKKKKIPSDSSSNNNNFAGLLLPLEETRVYGYLTNTQIKFVLIVEDEGPNAAEATAFDIQQLFEEIHELYTREIMNPFSNSGSSYSNTSSISDSNQLSKKFDVRVRKHIANFNQPEI